MKLIATIFMLIFVSAGCDKAVKIEEPAPIVAEPSPALPPAEPNDPEGKIPVPERALTPDNPAATEEMMNNEPELEGDGMDEPTPSPSPSVVPRGTPEKLKPGTVVELKAGKFIIIGLASETVSGQGGVTTYLTTIDGVKYRIRKPDAIIVGDYQKDPNVFATGPLPMGVDQAIASGKLTKEQIASIQMDEILKLFTYQDRDGGTNRHKEMAYLLQRFIVDGYLRGVNIIPIIRAQNDKLKLGVENIPYAREPNGVAVGEWVRYGDNFWEKNGNPFYVKLRTFYHELGHALLERSHRCTNSLMNSKCSPRPFPRGTNYEPMMKEFFDPSKWGEFARLEGKSTPYCPISATKAEIAAGKCPKTRP